MSRRKSTLYWSFIAVNIVLVCAMFVHASLKVKAATIILDEKRELVKSLDLTDLCLFTDARYTRHPALADLHTPFQDYPMSFEHFPSASILTAPPHLVHPSGLALRVKREPDRLLTSDTHLFVDTDQHH